MGLRPRRSLSQNFLTDFSTAQKIVSLVPHNPNLQLLEIGPGLGALTTLLLEFHDVIAVELDHLFAEYLGKRPEIACPHRLTVLERDILDCDLSREPFSQDSYFVVGNLPYQISSQIIFWALRNRKHIQGALLMLQAEMAERICAKPNTKSYAPITILSNLLFTITKCASISPNVFYPKPTVRSTVISLHPRPLEGILDGEINSFGDFLKKCFHARRKTLFNNLKSLDIPMMQLLTTFEKEEIHKDVRAEALTISQLIKLFHATNREIN